MINVEYCLDGRVQFTQMKLQSNNVRIVFSIFDQYNLKVPIKLDATLMSLVQVIQASLIQSKTYEESVHAQTNTVKKLVMFIHNLVCE